MANQPQEVDDIRAQRLLARQQQCGQISWRSRLFRTMHDQCPSLAVRVNDVRVVNALVLM